MSAEVAHLRAVSLRQIVTEDLARTAVQRGRPGIAMLLRRADVTGEELRCAALDLRAYSTQAAALGLLAAGLVREAAEKLADECGMELDAWAEESCVEQGVELGEELRGA